MADFSFSFDSDNPFAEPEPASPPAPVAPDAANGSGTNGSGANGEAANGEASVADAAEADASAFALDDFGFGEIEAPAAQPVAEPTAEQQGAASDDPFGFDFDLPQENTETAPPAPAMATGQMPVQAPIETFDGSDEPAPGAGIAADLIDIPTLEADAPPAAESSANAGDFDFSPGDETVAPAVAAPPILYASAGETSAEVETGEGEDSDDEPRRREAIPVPSVAVLGASGIGKNHARWFHRNGARVVAFLGTSEDSISSTQEALNAEFSFEGQAYTDLAKLLKTEQPDIVCVATPPALHFGHVLQSLEAGAHVLCEKPLVYAPTRKFRENRDGAKELVKVAGKKNLVLGTQLQYGAATPILCKLAGLAPNEVGDFAMEIETMNGGGARDPRELWIDLGPHPVSVAQMLAGEGAILAEETIRFEPHSEEGKTEVLARFGINCADGRLLMVRAIVRALDPATTKRKPRRRFSFNGHPIIYAPLAGPRGNYQAQFIAPDGYSSVYPDPVDYLVSNFVRACRGAAPLLISGDFGRENLEWMLKICTPPEAN